jgi:hypothetical protein
MNDPVKIDYATPPAPPKLSTVQLVKKTIGAAICLAVGAFFLLMAIAPLGLGVAANIRLPLIFGLIALLFILQSIRLFRAILGGR